MQLKFFFEIINQILWCTKGDNGGAKLDGGDIEGLQSVLEGIKSINRTINKLDVNDIAGLQTALESINRTVNGKVPVVQPVVSIQVFRIITSS